VVPGLVAVVAGGMTDLFTSPTVVVPIGLEREVDVVPGAVFPVEVTVG